MNLVDTHCHIQSVGAESGERITLELWAKAANLTAEKVIADARAVGVSKMICVGCDLEDSRLAVDFVQKRPECYASIGIHPHEAQHYVNSPDKLQNFCDLLNGEGAKKIVAVGETGLDFYYEHSPRDTQKELLKFQIELALKHNLPLIFHVRDAFDDFWPILDSYHGIRGVVHSFSADENVLDNVLRRGLYVGLNGIMTFSKQPEQLQAAKAVPLQKLLLETDAPFLTPNPYRGTINQPKHARRIAEFLADLRGEDVAALAGATSSNVRELFGI